MSDYEHSSLAKTARCLQPARLLSWHDRIALRAVAGATALCSRLRTDDSNAASRTHCSPVHLQQARSG
jgi:hypothetical protein